MVIKMAIKQQAFLSPAMFRSNSAAMALLKAQREDDVTKILEDDFFKQGQWLALGDLSKNYGLILAQHSDPVGALSEKITNARDAILLKACAREKIDPQGKNAPQNMTEAFEMFFGGPRQIERDWKKLEAERVIKIVADGEWVSGEGLPYNLLVVDRGCGQRPEDFHNTFCALLSDKSEKNKVPFLQGRYHMGGSGVLRYCGEKGYELIISKSAIKKGDWGWTLIRKNREERRYEYFVLKNGQVPSFVMDNIEVPDAKGKDITTSSITDGTVIKLYAYKTRRASAITSEGLKYDLDMFMYNANLPVVLIDARVSLGAKIRDISTAGIGDQMLRNESVRELLEDNMPITIDVNFGRLGNHKIEAFVFKSNAELVDMAPPKNDKQTAPLVRKKKRMLSTSMTILYLVNGQAHAWLSNSFIKTRCKKRHLADDILVAVDFSNVEGADYDDVFQSSRDRMNDLVRSDVEEILARALREDDQLKVMNEERKRRFTATTASEKPKEFIKQLLKESPDLFRYITEKGTDLKHRGHPERVHKPRAEHKDRPIYKSDFFPTEFTIKGHDANSSELFMKNIPINSIGTKMAFELNAPDDYFDRDPDTYPGKLNVEPADMFVSRNLSRGILMLKLKPTEGAEIGDVHQVTMLVSRYDAAPLIQVFKVKYIDAAERVPRNPGETVSDEEISNALPEPILITRPQWEQFEPHWTEEEVARIDDDQDPPVVSINIDADALQSYMYIHNIDKESAKDAVTNMYIGNVWFYAIAMYREAKKFADQLGEHYDPAEVTSKFS